MRGWSSRRIGPGTRSFLDGPAMDGGRSAAGRSTPAARSARRRRQSRRPSARWASATPPRRPLLAHKLTGLGLAELVGRGTGLDDAGLARKRAILAMAAARDRPRLAAGGGAARVRRLRDRHDGGSDARGRGGGPDRAGRRLHRHRGRDASPRRWRPRRGAAFVFAHLSAEEGHRRLLARMGAEPLLALDMRLGEGTGALLAWPLVQAAAAMLRDMASFASAGVSGPA